ncbi:MAG: B12-binding domain-containing radical SAM protein [Candidatus Omnitrophica bacterium]|nr:B12-binding domain-containing radical SAM protein [Candidatus Omnitrophota bacterium]
MMFDASKKRHRLRIIDPAYPAFNIYSYSARRTTPLGPVCVATAVNEMVGWDVEVIDENNLRRYGPQANTGADHEFLQRLRPADVVGLYGGLTSTIPRLYQIARFYKEAGILTIAGGQHFIEENIEEALSSGIDYVVIGEGEETIQELLQALMGKQDIGTVKGVAYKRDGKIAYTAARDPITDFDKLPLPDFSLVRYANIQVYPVERIRGCGMDCEFCTVKGKPRPASSERLLERISFLLETKDARKFFVVDDLFGQQRDETIRFCRMLKDYQKDTGRRLDLGVQIRLDKAKDPELLTAMRQAGINFVAIGFESPIGEELKAMNKRLRPEDMLAFTKIFRRFGFLAHGMFIFGYPVKTGVNFRMSASERIKYFKSFIRKSKLDTIQVLLPVPLPGTELRQRLKQQNRIYPFQDLGWEYYDGNFLLFQPDQPMSAEEMQASPMKIMGKVYQFKYMFMVSLNVFAFPYLVFFLHNIKSGWKKWYRPWRMYLIRFVGWITMKKWLSAFKKNDFLKKLQQAKKNLGNSRESGNS